MAKPLDDDQVQARIEELEAEERALRQDEADTIDGVRKGDPDEDARRLQAIKVELDRLWDYLRQRRALRDAGQDPDGASMRDAGTVEDYLG
jgi:hypothetical protein